VPSWRVQGLLFLKTIDALLYLNSPEFKEKMKLPLMWNIFFSSPFYRAELFRQLALTQQSC
jgi:hypothetical protein